MARNGSTVTWCTMVGRLLVSVSTAVAVLLAASCGAAVPFFGDPGATKNPGASKAPGDGTAGGNGRPKAARIDPCTLIAESRAANNHVEAGAPEERTFAVSESTGIVYDACRRAVLGDDGSPEEMVTAGFSVTPIDEKGFARHRALARQETEVVLTESDGSLDEVAENPEAFYTSDAEDGPYGRRLEELFVRDADRVLVVSRLHRRAMPFLPPLLTKIAVDALSALPDDPGHPVVTPAKSSPWCDRIDPGVVRKVLGSRIVVARGADREWGVQECAFVGESRLVSVRARTAEDVDEAIASFDRAAKRPGWVPVPRLGHQAIRHDGSGVLAVRAGTRLAEVTVRPDQGADRLRPLAEAVLAADGEGPS